MKRYLAIVLMTAILITSLMMIPVSAVQPGEAIGNVLYSDVVAYIDGYPIRSYNINGYTYIIAEDLLSYGFYVEWRGSEGKLIIHTARTANYTANYVPEKNTHVVGSIAFPYLYTNVTTWIGSNQITGYNIGGNTCICLDDLYKYFGGSYVWNPADVTLRLNTANAPQKANNSSANAFQRLKEYAISYGKLSDGLYSKPFFTHYLSDSNEEMRGVLTYTERTGNSVVVFTLSVGEIIAGLFINSDARTPYQWIMSDPSIDAEMSGNLYPSLYRKNGSLNYTTTNCPYPVLESFHDLAETMMSVLIGEIDRNLASVITLEELGFVNFN